MLRLLTFVFFITISFSGQSEEISLKSFFKEAEFRNLKISPDGKHLAAKVRSERKYILVILDIQSLKPVYVFQFDGEQEHVGAYHWVNDERVVFTKSIQSDTDTQPRDSGNIFAGNINGEKRNVIFGFNAKNGRTAKGSASKRGSGFGRIVALLDEDPNYISIVGYKGTEASPPTLYKVNVYTGKRKRITGLPIPRASVVVDQKGQPVFSEGINTFGEYSQFVYKKDGWENVTDKLGFDGAVYIYGYNKLRDKIYLSNYNIEDGQEVLFTFNPKDLSVVETYKAKGHDIVTAIYDPTSDDVIGLNTMPGKIETIYLDKNNPYAKLHKALAKNFLNEHVSFISFSEDYSKGIISVRSDKNIGDFYLVDVNKLKVDYLVSVKSWLDPAKMSSRSPITFEARDGQKIHGYLTLPTKYTEPLNLITLVHGGPYGPRDRWFYDEDAQILANRGYAVLQVNFRGSGGYGKAFEAVAYQKQHTLIMEDIIDGTKWAQAKEQIHDTNACVYGWSFGGYAAALLSIKGSEVFKCSIAAAAPVDKEYQYSNADYSRSLTLEKEIDLVYGNSKELWRKQSPTNYVDDVKLPIFLIHGGKDARVPYEQAESFKNDLMNAGKEVEWLYKWEEPHGFLKVENKIELYSKIFKFLDKHIN